MNDAPVSSSLSFSWPLDIGSPAEWKDARDFSIPSTCTMALDRSSDLLLLQVEGNFKHLWMLDPLFSPHSLT